MPDKDFLVVISEMLQKQDQQAKILKDTNETLKNFVSISIQQFEQQHAVNEKFNNQFERFNLQFEKFNIQFDKQNQFNERFIDKLDDIEKAIKK